MTPYTAVIIATKGRPQAVSNILDALALQTVLPDVVVISASNPSDINRNDCAALNLQTIFGSAGLTAQRNRALALLQGKCDIVVFFDDDFVPSRFWIERIQILLATYPDVGCVTGRVLADGVRSGGLEWSVGKSIVDKSDSSTQVVAMINQIIKDGASPYGCNMAFRAKAIEHLKFDERLVLYGWLEDRDFGFRAALETKTILTDFLWGVHLGISQGRTSGLKFGYSQIVNPWYLMKRGSLTPRDALRYIARGFAGNVGRLNSEKNAIDRWGRLKGNIIGITDILIGRGTPERITKL